VRFPDRFTELSARVRKNLKAVWEGDWAQRAESNKGKGGSVAKKSLNCEMKKKQK